MEDLLVSTIQPLLEKISMTIHTKNDLYAPEIMEGYTLIYRCLLKNKTSEKNIEDIARFQRSFLSLFIADLCGDDLILAHQQYRKMKKSLGTLFYYANRLYGILIDDKIFVEEYINRHSERLFGMLSSRIVDGIRNGSLNPVDDALLIFRTLDKDLGTCIFDRFERFFIPCLSEVFQETYQEWSSLDIPLYVNKVLDYESKMYQIVAANKIIESIGKIRKELVRVFVSHRMDIMSHFSDCLFTCTELDKYYKFVKLHNISLCFDMYKSYLKKSVKSYPKDGKILIEFMISFHAKEEFRLETILLEKDFKTILSDHWKIFINKNKNVLMLLVKHIDKKIRKGVKDLSALQMFCYVNDKDEFLCAYKSLLTKRLIGDETPDLELETYYIGWLEQKMTRSFVLSLYTMINEYVINKENNLRLNTNPMIQVMIVCYSQWGISKDLVEYKLPFEIQSQMSEYLDLFRQNKTFTFIHHLGTVHLKGIFSGGVYEFVMNPIQALYLLRLTDQWQDLEKLETIVSEKRDVNCKAILESLDLLVEKNTNTGYRLKTSFLSKKRIHHFSFIELARSEQETRKEETTFDRYHVIDATIIRILKSKRQIYFKDLLIEMQNHIKTFQPEITDIKTRLSRLIDNDFAARDEADNNLILYVN